jgi:hypothetical protein
LNSFFESSYHPLFGVNHAFTAATFPRYSHPHHHSHRLVRALMGAAVQATIQDLIRVATRLTRAGRLDEATAAIQKALSIKATAKPESEESVAHATGGFKLPRPVSAVPASRLDAQQPHGNLPTGMTALVRRLPHDLSPSGLHLMSGACSLTVCTSMQP